MKQEITTKQELVPMEALPIKAKEIQIPSEELSTVQKSHYRKDIEEIRDDMIRKIDAIKKFKKSQYVKTGYKRMEEEISKNGFGKLIKEANKTIAEYNGLVRTKLLNLSSDFDSVNGKFDGAVKDEEYLKAPSLKIGSVSPLHAIKTNDIINTWNFENLLDKEFQEKDGVPLEKHKKQIQAQYKILKNALSFYKVDYFRKLIVKFLKTAETINRIYHPIIADSKVIDID